MIRLKTLYLGKLLVKELGSLAGLVRIKLGVLVTGKHIPEKMVTNLDVALQQFDVAVGSDANPEQTKKLHAFDDLTDSSLEELKGIANGAAVRRDEKIRSAGLEVLQAIRKRGYEMQNFPIRVQMDTVEQLVADIKASPTLTASVATIGATEVITRIEKENGDTKAYWLSIREGKASSSVSSFEGTRQLRAAVSQVFQYLNTMSDIEPEVANTIEQINAILEPYISALKTRETNREKKKEEAKK
jgi:hypothetical protein